MQEGEAHGRKDRAAWDAREGERGEGGGELEEGDNLPRCTGAAVGNSEHRNCECVWGGGCGCQKVVLKGMRGP